MNSYKNSKPRKYLPLVCVHAANSQSVVHLEGFSRPLQWQNVCLLPCPLLYPSRNPEEVLLLTSQDTGLKSCPPPPIVTADSQVA